MIVAPALLLLLAAQDAPDPPRCHRTVSYADNKFERHGCTEFETQREFTGLWINEFEGQRFVEDATSAADIPRGRGAHQIWFEVDAQTGMPPEWKRSRGARLYWVRFRGKAAKDMRRKPMEGYGHFGMSSGIVLVDEVLEIRAVDDKR